ncbi:hypothetical protein BTR22_06935 [Alkalihalophilus pseudofirmus]|uniref:response regulator n=1 Tax=Alkalihalophilus pseudofirmus TaxID=79885 RepID=UPI000951A0F1|nr:hypothetical protein BTR22_06935 [Alkalihalophilus pseudofirmus]
MEANKYQQMLFKRFNDTQLKWKSANIIDESELYRFFHSIKGTAATIEMEELSQRADASLQMLNEHSTRQVPEADWLPLLMHVKEGFPEKFHEPSHGEIAAALEDSKITAASSFILIIHENLSFISAARTLLEDNGYQVLTAVTPIKAVELLIDFEPSLIIMSPKLPETEELELVESITKRAKEYLIPILLLDDSLSMELKISAYDMGITDIISPLFTDDLFLPLLRNRLLLHKEMISHQQKGTISRENAVRKAFHSIQLIIIDDDEIVRKMLTHHFTKKREIASYTLRVKSYANGVDFLDDDWYEENQPYLILLDGMMPKMDGIEVLQTIKTNFNTKYIIVSMLTARKGDAEVSRALALGADDYMIKPFNVQEVSTRIEKMIERVLSK